MGFEHKQVTPVHPKSQGQVENFNKLINKTTKIACEEGIEIESAIYDMLQAYRQTPIRQQSRHRMRFWCIVKFEHD